MTPLPRRFRQSYFRNEIRATIRGGMGQANLEIEIQPTPQRTWSFGAKVEVLIQPRDTRTNLPVGAARRLLQAIVSLREEANCLMGYFWFPLWLSNESLLNCHLRITPVKLE